MAKEGKGAFHVTIVDNETGRVLADEETDCIIGAANVAGKKDVNRFAFSNGKGEDVLNVLRRANQAIEFALAQLPEEVQLLYKLLSLLDRDKVEADA